MRLDALIVADSGTLSVSGSSQMRFAIDGRSATIQTVNNYLGHKGRIVPPIDGDSGPSWSSAPKLNGITLLSDLLQHDYRAALVNDFARDRERFLNLLRERPLAIVVSTTFILRKAELNTLVCEIRALAPDIPIIVGGPFVTRSIQIRERAKDPGFFHPGMRDDYLFWGHQEPSVDLFITDLRGQKILRKALDRLRTNIPLSGLSNTAWREPGGALQFGPSEPTPQSQSEDFIDWGMLPDDIFATQVIPLQASSGCPYRCAFCNFVRDQHTAYSKPIEHIIREMRAVARRGVKYVWFVDDNFRHGKGDLTTVSRAILDADLELKWMTLIRADTVKDVDFQLLKKAGCHELQFGLESADPEVLKAMNKKSDPEIYRTVIERALTAGINVSAYFLVGHPGETPESVDRTIQFMREIQYPDLPGNLSWSIYPFILAPLSPIYEPELRRRYDLEGYMMDWQHSTMDSEAARAAIKKIIMALDSSAPITRDDNLDMLGALDPSIHKAFCRARLQLAKLAVSGEADPDTVYRFFHEILSQRQPRGLVCAG